MGLFVLSSLNRKDWDSNKVDDKKKYFEGKQKIVVYREKNISEKKKLDEKHEISLAGSFLKFGSRNSSGGIARQTVNKNELDINKSLNKIKNCWYVYLS